MTFEIEIYFHAQTSVAQSRIWNPYVEDPADAQERRAIDNSCPEPGWSGDAGKAYKLALHKVFEPSRATQPFIEFREVASAPYVSKPSPGRLFQCHLEALLPVVLARDHLASLSAHPGEV